MIVRTLHCAAQRWSIQSSNRVRTVALAFTGHLRAHSGVLDLRVNAS